MHRWSMASLGVVVFYKQFWLTLYKSSERNSKKEKKLVYGKFTLWTVRIAILRLVTGPILTYLKQPSWKSSFRNSCRFPFRSLHISFCRFSFRSSCRFPFKSACRFSFRSSCRYSFRSSCRFSLRSSSRFSFRFGYRFPFKSSRRFSFIPSCRFSFKSSCRFSFWSSYRFSLRSSCNRFSFTSTSTSILPYFCPLSFLEQVKPSSGILDCITRTSGDPTLKIIQPYFVFQNI